MAFDKTNHIQYKTYSGWSDFNYVGTHYLKIVLVKKAGWFCSTCKQDLEENCLAENYCKNEEGANSFDSI